MTLRLAHLPSHSVTEKDLTAAFTMLDGGVVPDFMQWFRMIHSYGIETAAEAKLMEFLRRHSKQAAEWLTNHAGRRIDSLRLGTEDADGFILLKHTGEAQHTPRSQISEVLSTFLSTHQSLLEALRAITDSYWLLYYCIPCADSFHAPLLNQEATRSRYDFRTRLVVPPGFVLPGPGRPPVGGVPELLPKVLAVCSTCKWVCRFCKTALALPATPDDIVAMYMERVCAKCFKHRLTNVRAPKPDYRTLRKFRGHWHES